MKKLRQKIIYEPEGKHIDKSKLDIALQGQLGRAVQRPNNRPMYQPPRSHVRTPGLRLFWPIAPRHQLKGKKEREVIVVSRLIPMGRGDVGEKGRRYHAYVVPVQKSLRKFRRLATFWCYLTGDSKGDGC